jgi:hypothetical protein
VITSFDIDSIFEALLAACGELGQNHMADKVVSTIFLTFCRLFAALTFIE